MLNTVWGKLDEFTVAYFEAALWSSIDDAENPLDSNYGIEDFASETAQRMIADCAKFQEDNTDVLNAEEDPRTYARQDYGYSVNASAGHDFWLTRNGHGAGFWDGDWNKDAEKRLNESSDAFGAFELYVGDDGKIYYY